jgi:pyroglutamyl-peptidase
MAMRVLLTSFAPFPGVPVNATQRLVPELADRAKRRFPGVRVFAAQLPTEWQAAPRQLDVLSQEVHPHLLLHFGVSARARGFEIEQRGRNRCALEADAVGALPTSPAVREGGPEVLRVTLPLSHIVAHLRRRSIPAYLSRDAGGYLCNATLYTSLEAARSSPGRRVGFIHVPTGLAQPGTGMRGLPGACPLTWAQAIEGGLEILAACLNRVGACPGVASADRHGSQHRR